MKFLSTYFFFLISLYSFSKQSKIDSLFTLLNTDKEDTAKITHLNELGWELKYQNPDTSIILSNQALVLCEQLSSFQNLKSNTLGNIGVYYYIKADYPLALDYQMKALKIDEELNNKKGIAARLGNIGIVYTNQGEYPKALDYYFKALKIDEELSDEKGIATRLANIGVVYDYQGDYQKTLDYYFKSLKMLQKIGDKNRIASILGNIGAIYEVQGDYRMALDYDFKALKMAEEIGNKNLIAVWLGNIGNVYNDQAASPLTPLQRRGELQSKALDYYFKALKMAEEIGDKHSIAINLGNIGSLYTKAPYLLPPPMSAKRPMKQNATGEKGKKGFLLAEEYLLRSLSIAEEIRSLDDIKEGHKNLSELYNQMAEAPGIRVQLAKKVEYLQKALGHYKQYTTAKDSLFNMEKEEDIVRKEMNYEFEKKEIAAQAEHKLQIAVAETDKKRQNIIIWSIAIGLFIVALFSIVLFNRLRVTRMQKHIIDEKNRHITDSINYAKRIQDSILPSDEVFRKYFSEYFIFFKPRDIVSGDFYWISTPFSLGSHYKSMENKVEGLVVLAVADCTGHGVPGAFMSMIGNTLLNEIVNEKLIYQPGEILNRLNEGVMQSLHQGAANTQDDGMDISICLFDKEKKTLSFAGANQSLFFSNGDALKEIKGDIFSIGGMSVNKNVSFSQTDIPLSKGMNIFLSTDGYSDQPGGKEGKRFMTKRLHQIFQNITGLDGKEQLEKVKGSYDVWKGERAQLDDILVMGIKW